VPEELAKLSHAEQLQVQEALSGKLSSKTTIRVLKNASFHLNEHKDFGAGRALIQKGVEIAKANHLEHTTVGYMLRRDLADMENNPYFAAHAMRPPVGASAVAAPAAHPL
jgi:hypothetical protein